MKRLFTSIWSALIRAVVCAKHACSSSAAELAESLKERIAIADWVKEVDAITCTMVAHIDTLQDGPAKADNQVNREVFSSLERFGAAQLLGRMPNIEKYGEDWDKFLAQEFKVLVEKDMPVVLESRHTGLNRVVYRCGRIRAIVSPNEK